MRVARAIQGSGAGPVTMTRRTLVRRGLVVGGLALAATAPFGRAALAADESAIAQKVKGQFTLWLKPKGNGPFSIQTEALEAIKGDKKGVSQGTVQLASFDTLLGIVTQRPAWQASSTNGGSTAKESVAPTIILEDGPVVTRWLTTWYEDGEDLRAPAQAAASSSGTETQSSDGLREAGLAICDPDGDPLFSYDLAHAFVRDLQLAPNETGDGKIIRSLEIEARSLTMTVHERGPGGQVHQQQHGSYEWNSVNGVKSRPGNEVGW
jgi:hypothetical protein